MARIRTIKPEFCSSHDVGALSRDARLFFLQLLTEADDEGRLLWIPRKLAGVLYPHDDDVTGKMVEKWAAECEARGMLLRYFSGGSPCVRVTNWEKHQKISHPTKSRLIDTGEPLRSGSGNPPEELRSPPETFRPDLGTGNREQGKEREREEAASPPPADAGPTSEAMTEVLREWNELPPPFPKASKLTDSRRRFLRARLADPGWRDAVPAALVKIRGSPFCRGENDRGWVADIDFLLKPDTVTKLIEGKYDGKPTGAGGGRGGTALGRVEPPPGKYDSIDDNERLERLAAEHPEWELGSVAPAARGA